MIFVRVAPLKCLTAQFDLLYTQAINYEFLRKKSIIENVQ